LPSQQNPGKRQSVIAVIVKRAHIARFDWPRVSARHSPNTSFVVCVRGIIRLAQIRAVANGGKPLQVDGDQLTSDSQPKRAAANRFTHADECLFHVEPISVNGRLHRLAWSIGALEL
jgi:hypothetical protein